MSLVRGIVCPKLLLAATDQPQTAQQLLEALKQRGTPIHAAETTVTKGLLSLTRRGLLERSGLGIPKHPYRYAHTAQGRAALDVVWEPQ